MLSTCLSFSCFSGFAEFVTNMDAKETDKQFYAHHIHLGCGAREIYEQSITHLLKFLIRCTRIDRHSDSHGSG